MNTVQSPRTLGWTQKCAVETICLERKRSYHSCSSETVPSVAVGVTILLPPLTALQRSYRRVLPFFMNPATLNCKRFGTGSDSKKVSFPMPQEERKSTTRPIRSVANQGGHITGRPESAIQNRSENANAKPALNPSQRTPIVITYSTTVLLVPNVITCCIGARLYIQFTESLEHRDIQLVNRCFQNFLKSGFRMRIM